MFLTGYFIKKYFPGTLRPGTNGKGDWILYGIAAGIAREVRDFPGIPAGNLFPPPEFIDSPTNDKKDKETNHNRRSCRDVQFRRDKKSQ